MTLQQMAAEICFCFPDEAASATVALKALGFGIEQLDWIDVECGGDHVWLVVRSGSLVSEDTFHEQVRTAVEPFGGFVVVAGEQAGIERYIADADKEYRSLLGAR